MYILWIGLIHNGSRLPYKIFDALCQIIIILKIYYHNKRKIIFSNHVYFSVPRLNKNIYKVNFFILGKLYIFICKNIMYKCIECGINVEYLKKKKKMEIG